MGDRTLAALQPPLFDNPGTVGFYDDRSRILFSSDCFGGLLPSMDAATVSDGGEIPEEPLSQGQVQWATMKCSGPTTSWPIATRARWTEYAASNPA